MSRQLPHSNEAEQSILGAMLVYPSVIRDVKDQSLLKADFYLDVHARIFETMMDIHEQDKPVDVVGVITRLNDLEQLNLVGGADYILKLGDSAISGANALYYIELIKNRAHVRRLIETAELIAQEGFESGDELDDIMDRAEKEILLVTRNRLATNFKSSREVINIILKELEELRKNKDGITGVRTGYRELDYITNGFQRGDLIILAARPSMGKTAFALNVALNASGLNDGAVAIFSLEMPAESLMKRILSAKARLEGSKLRTGFLKGDEINKLNETANELMGRKMFIDDSSNVKMAEIYSKCRKLKSEHGLDMIVIDYLQLISGSSKSSSDNRQQEVSEISRSLKGLAREMEVPVIALSQLSRSVETRQDKRPMLSDLRESGAIEQDADIVMFLYRDKYYNREENEEFDVDKVDRTEINIAKHRNGATGQVELAFAKSYNAFYDYDESN